MSDGSKNRGKKRPKSYYLKCAKQARHKPCMEVGQKGFLVTCNNRERECTRESYSLLNRYADTLYGPEESNENKDGEDVLDIEEEVKRELESLKKSTQNERRFQAVDSRARNCIFIRTKVPDPSYFIHKILTDIQTTQKQCSRYILRATPVLSVCRANLDDIKSCAEKVLPQYFEETGSNGKTYAIIIKVRNNATLSRNDIIPALGSIISSLSSSNKADLNSPHLAVLVDVIGKFCCLGVAEDYYNLKKYNLAELTVKEKINIKDVEEKGDEIQENDEATATDEHESPEKFETDESATTKMPVTEESDTSKTTESINDKESTKA